MRNKDYFTLSIIGIIVLSSFLAINKLNYLKIKQIQTNTIHHPENIPTQETAKYTTFGFQNIKADMYRLEAVQYIGGNAIGAEYKKYLFVLLDLITSLNPYFENPYIIGQLLLPNYSPRYENLSFDEVNKYNLQAETLGLKGVKNFCNLEKVERIKKQDNLNIIWTNPDYKNPCKSYSTPYYLAYIYFYYLHNPKEASNYYKVASANDDALEGAKVMAAIMQGKTGERQKSYFMFLNIAKTIKGNDEVCQEFAQNLENIGSQIYLKKSLALDEKIVKTINELRDKIFGKFDEKKESEILSNTACSNYLNKAVRELNLEYISQANARYENDNKGIPSFNAKELFTKGYIKYLPIDFQQYQNYGIIYEYNPDIKTYDYKMGNYGE